MSILSLGDSVSSDPRLGRPRHSRLDNAGLEGDYSIFDERPFLQAISETPFSNRVNHAQF